MKVDPKNGLQIPVRNPIETAFDLKLGNSPWHGGNAQGLRRNTKIWNPPETYLEWVAMIFPDDRSLEAAHRTFRSTEQGILCPAIRHLTALILPKEGCSAMKYLFQIVQSPMEECPPKTSVALYHKACVHEAIMERLPKHTSNSAQARRLWFRITQTGRNSAIQRSDTFLIAKSLDEEIKKLLLDTTFDAWLP